MTRDDAIYAMQEGYKVKHIYFSDDEFIYMKGNIIYDENDYRMGTIGEFFQYRQGEAFLTDWSILKEERTVIMDEISDEHINDIRLSNPFMYDESDYEYKPLKRGHYESIRTEPKINRNSICSCGSGKKYKKCCLNC